MRAQNKLSFYVENDNMVHKGKSYYQHLRYTVKEKFTIIPENIKIL